MTYFEAARVILSSAPEPLTTREITDRALEKGLIGSRGRTPHNSMSAALYKRLAVSSELIKIQAPGKTRAARGSVRWTLRTKRSG
jgi:hypothetical protein